MAFGAERRKTQKDAEADSRETVSQRLSPTFCFKRTRKARKGAAQAVGGGAGLLLEIMSMIGQRESILGPVLQEWDVLALGELGTWGGGSTPRKSNTEYWGGTMPWVFPKDMGEPVVKRTEDHVTRQALSQTNLTVYRPGSVVVVFRSGVLRHTFPVATLDQPFTVNQDMKVLSTWDAVDDRFVFHLLRCMGPLVLQRATKVGTTVESVDTTSFKSLPVGLPPLAEQRRIADVLDTVDAAIRETDDVIAKQEQVKTGLLQNLLTRGLDAEGRLRDPEAFRRTEKLGAIPRGWEVGTLEDLLAGRPRNGYSPKQVDEWTGVQMLGLGCLTEEGFEPRQLKNAPRDDSRIERALLSDGDLLVSRSNTRERVALAGIYRDVGSPCIYPDLMMRVEANSKTSNEFIELLLRHGFVRRQLTGAAQETSGSMVKINATTLLGTKVPIIDKTEQERILSRYDRAIERREAERGYNSKLQRLKTGLMQDLLTGRVRVPDVERRVEDVVS